MPNTPEGSEQPDNVVALNQARNEGRTSALAYAREVNDLCMLAGKSEKASAFIEQNTSLNDVRTALLDARASTDAAADDLPPHHPGSQCDACGQVRPGRQHEGPLRRREGLRRS